MPRFGVIADDLTGACDAGVHFAAQGLATVVWLASGPPPDVDVVVLSTASRRDSPGRARRKIQEALGRLGDRRLLFKKVDSTLRGNVTAEIRAVLELASPAPAEAWLAPAFPAMGRTVEDGWLHLGGSRTATRLESRDGLRVFDTRRQEDLAEIARLAFAQDPPPLLCGSAGLAIEVARRVRCPEMAGGPDHAAGPAPRIAGRSAPAALFVGSTHAVTLAQVAHLKARRDVRQYRMIFIPSMEGDLAGPVARYHARGSSGLILTGGDTAAIACRALRVWGIRLLREVLPGIPYGTLIGGAFDGLPVVTKAGGFGAEDTLDRAVSALREGIG